AVTGVADSLSDTTLQSFGRHPFCPILAVDLPAHVPVTGRRDRCQHPRIGRPVAERAAEPRPRVHPEGLADRLLSAPDVVSDPFVREMRHAPVVVAVTGDD